jgi:hypothetical protein
VHVSVIEETGPRECWVDTNFAKGRKCTRTDWVSGPDSRNVREVFTAMSDVIHRLD